jgi:hypothetical protein
MSSEEYKSIKFLGYGDFDYSCFEKRFPTIRLLSASGSDFKEEIENYNGARAVFASVPKLEDCKEHFALPEHAEYFHLIVGEQEGTLHISRAGRPSIPGDAKYEFMRRWQIVCDKTGVMPSEEAILRLMARVDFNCSEISADCIQDMLYSYVLHRIDSYQEPSGMIRCYTSHNIGCVFNEILPHLSGLDLERRKNIISEIDRRGYCIADSGKIVPLIEAGNTDWCNAYVLPAGFKR